MQRYRVNYKLLVSVFVGAVVLAVGSFALWHFQVNRKATVFRENAKLAKDEGKNAEAFDLLLKYVQLRRDEVEPQIELAHIALDLINDQQTDQEVRSQAFAVLEQTVRRTGDPELARELVKIIISFRPQDALSHLEELLRDNPDDTELLAMQAQALYRVKGVKPAMELSMKLVGFDRATQKFDSSKSKVKDRPEVYSLLAGLIVENDKDDEELAEKVIDEMVAVNPKSARALLNQAVFLRTVDKKDESNKALDKAYELDPSDADVLQQIGAVAFDDKDYEKAEKVFRDGIEKHPDRLLLYDLLSRALIQEEKFDEALAVLDQGIERIGAERALVFSRSKLNIYFQQQDYASVEKELAKLAKLDNPALQPFIDFSKARIVWQKQEWTEAARLLRELRPKLIDYPQEQAMAGVLLATSYERQGKYDLAMQIYTEVVEKHPSYEAAKMGLANLRDKVNPQGDKVAADLDAQIDAMAKLPESEQDWSKIDKLIEQIAKDREFSEARLKLVRANVLIKRKQFEEAKTLIREAAELEPDNVGVRYAAVSLLSIDPDAGPKKALDLLAQIETKFGDSFRVRASRAALLRQAKDDNVAEQLEALADGIEAWPPAEQAELLSTIAAQFEVLKDFDRANTYLQRATKLVPDSLPARARQFEIAFAKRDIEGMKAAEKSILDLVQDENDGNYIYSVVRRMMLQYSMQEITREELADARKMLDDVLARRPQWAEAHILYGQLLLVLEEDQELALQHLNDALKYGPPNANALGLQVRLLGQRSLFNEALEKLNMIPEEMRLSLLGRAEAEILLFNNDWENAYESAQKLAELEAENASTQIWFARIAAQARDLIAQDRLKRQSSGKLSETERSTAGQDAFQKAQEAKMNAALAALGKATKLTPADADVWMQLLTLQASLKDVEGIEDTLRRAQLSVETDYLPLLTAKKYELLGDWRTAEKIYLASFADRMDDPAIAQRMAEFYLLWAQQGKANVSHASPYINLILRQANEDKLEASNPYVAWARDKAARLLAATGDYQESLKAQRLLGGEGDIKTIPPTEKALLADILASRNEPAAQLKAINLLSEMDTNKTITRDGVLNLAKLLSKAGKSERSNDLMLNAIQRFGNDEAVRATFINLLIDRGDFAMASKQLEDLKKINAQSSAYISLSIKLAAKSGNRGRLRQMLEKMVPPNLAAGMTPEELERVLMVARLATEHEEYELASKLYGVYVSRKPDANMEYMRYLALYGDVEMAMGMLEKTFPQARDEVLQIATEMLRKRRTEFGDKYDARINELVAAALRDDPDSVRRLLVEAEVLEVEGNYKESIAKYDSVLKRDDVPRVMRAAAKNNLGFLLTLLNERTEEAERLINEAMEVYGPVSDILDTRAIVRMSLKEYDQAVEDMSLATSLSDDPVKFYHYAQANLLAGNDQAALKAWEKAQDLGITKEKLPILEQKNFDQVKSEIEGLRTQNAKL
jgi:tetratricopeptide (TPR) repeat protein